MPLLTASLTDSLVTLATNLIADLGLAGVALLTLSSGVIGVPGTEPTMLFAGFDVFRGNLSLVGIILAGWAGDLLGATIAYAIGYYGRRELVETHGNKLHIDPAGLDRAHRWFERWGAPVIIVSRLLPFIRAVFPYAAGVARMPFGRFISFAAVGSLIWIGALGLLGRAVGASWQSWRHHLEYVDYAAVVIFVAAVGYWLYRRRRNHRDGGRPSEPATDVASD